MFNLIYNVMKNVSRIIIFTLLIITNISWSQTDTLKVSKPQTNLNEALKNPLNVKTLNLSNQNIIFEPDFFFKI